jgi:hypothetical protein
MRERMIFRKAGTVGSEVDCYRSRGLNEKASAVHEGAWGS